MKEKKNIWAVFGVSNQSKDIAKKLSKKSGKKIGEWLDLVISDQELMENITNRLEDPDSLKISGNSNSSFGSQSLATGTSGYPSLATETSRAHNSAFDLRVGALEDMRTIFENQDSFHEKLDDLTKQVANLAMQIYDLKIYEKFEKKSFWSRFL
jgi:hypothetical protein